MHPELRDFQRRFWRTLPLTGSILHEKLDALLTDKQCQAMARAQRSFGWMGSQ